MKKYGTLARILFISRLAMIVFAVVLLEIERSIVWAMLAWLLYYGIILGLSLRIIAPDMIRAKGSFDYSRITKYTIPLGIAGIITVFSGTADQVVVGGYLTSGSLGIYNAALTVSGVLGVVLVTPLVTALLPEASSSSMQATVSNGYRLALRFAVMGLLPASLLATAIAPQLLSLFTGGRGYLAGASSLELITVFYILSAIQTISMILLQAIGKTTQIMIVGAITAATDILMAISLVPTFGILGAAGSKVTVFLVGALISVYLLKKYSKNLDIPQFYLKGAIFALIPLVPEISLSYFVSSRIITIVPYTVLYFALFLVCVKISKLLTNEDRTFLSHILPRSMQQLTKYI